MMFSNARAQSQDTLGADAGLTHIKSLQIGDNIPEELWHLPLQIVNHPDRKGTTTLNDYRGKLIILDFWATWCGSCIANMPKISKLQEELGDEVQVLLITKEKLPKVDQFFKRNPFSLISVVNDETFNRLFTHLAIPHYSIINKQGTIQAITSSDQITTDNIRRILDDRTAEVTVKIDRDTKSPLLTTSNLPLDRLSHHSVLFEGRLDGFPSSVDQREYGDVVGVTYTNMALAKLFKAVFRKLYPDLNDKRFLFESGDSTKFFYPVHNTISSKQEWYKKNLYSYEVLVKNEKSNDIFNHMLNDLNNHTQFSGILTTRKRRCIQLVFRKKSSSYGKDAGMMNGQQKNFEDIPVENLVSYLDDSSQIPFPVINGINSPKKVNVTITSKFENLEDIRKQLNKQGLDLIDVLADIPVFVISQKQ
ncbi:TlpA family protein disulfide reductase [Sphingobacterium sp. UBA7038]|uniref:TlpA family protein disulfide reductase n=1 Tax=Sphingobacterium TaxID=28453 RepID=UPI0025806790|nr:TlpA disulfide reductase family protein [Sphingobacterium sp. UBA7038]